MTDRLLTRYSISWSGTEFTITYVSGFSPVSFSGFNYTLSQLDSGNYFIFGAPGAETLLDRTKCNSPDTGANMTEFFNNIRALAVYDISLQGADLQSCHLVSCTIDGPALSGARFSDYTLQFEASGTLTTVTAELPAGETADLTIPYVGATAKFVLFGPGEALDFVPDQAPCTTLTDANQTWKVYRLPNNFVRIVFPALSVTASSATTFRDQGCLPSDLRPAASIRKLMTVVNGGAAAMGSIELQSNGHIYIGTGTSVGNFNSTGTCGWPSDFIEYKLGSTV